MKKLVFFLSCLVLILGCKKRNETYVVEGYLIHQDTKLGIKDARVDVRGNKDWSSITLTSPRQNTYTNDEGYYRFEFKGSETFYNCYFDVSIPKTTYYCKDNVQQDWLKSDYNQPARHTNIRKDFFFCDSMRFMLKNISKKTIYYYFSGKFKNSDDSIQTGKTKRISIKYNAPFFLYYSNSTSIDSTSKIIYKNPTNKFINPDCGTPLRTFELYY